MPGAALERTLRDPVVGPGDKPYFDAARQGTLLVKRCAQCDAFHHYPRALCPFCLSDDVDPNLIARSIDTMVDEVRTYVPGYRLKQPVQFERVGAVTPLKIPGLGSFRGLRSSIFLEIEGAGHYLPAYAGNLDIMTSAALKTAERLAEGRRN